MKECLRFFEWLWWMLIWTWAIYIMVIGLTDFLLLTSVSTYFLLVMLRAMQIMFQPMIALFYYMEVKK